jgi:hypothetical protein
MNCCYSLLLSLALMFPLFFNPTSVLGVFYIKLVQDGNVLFPPYAFMQYGPSPDASVTLWQTLSRVTGANGTTAIFNPHVNIDNVQFAVNSTLMPITTKSILQPSFDSFFIWNKYLEPNIPRISNITAELAPILNPLEVQQIQQVDIGPSVPLIMNEDDQNYLPSFSIPSYLADGFYFIQLFIDFPDQGVSAVYANTLCLGDCVSALLDQMTEEGTNVPLGNNSELNDHYGSNDLLLGLNQTIMG